MNSYIVREIRERRVQQPAIPEDYETLLNEPQLKSLKELESCNWTLKFVRRPLFQPVTPVLIDKTGNFTMVVEEDGMKNIRHGLELRFDLDEIYHAVFAATDNQTTVG